VLDAGVRIEDDFAGRVGDEPDGQRHGQFAAARLGQLPAAEAGAVKCSSASDMVPFNPRSSRSLKLAGSLEAVLVADEGVGERADLQQPMPVGVVASQA
jgi:hypothetical protein